MAKSGPKSQALRNFWIFLLVTELEKKDKRNRSRAISEAYVTLSKRWGIQLSIPSIWGAYYEGAKIKKSGVLSWTPPVEKSSKQMGRPRETSDDGLNMDAVRDIIVHDLVAEALKKGHTLRQSYRIASASPWSMGLGLTSIRNIYKLLASIQNTRTEQKSKTD